MLTIDGGQIAVPLMRLHERETGNLEECSEHDFASRLDLRKIVALPLGEVAAIVVASARKSVSFPGAEGRQPSSRIGDGTVALEHPGSGVLIVDKGRVV